MSLFENGREQLQSLTCLDGVWDVTETGVSTVGTLEDFIFGTQGMPLVNKLSNKSTLNIIVMLSFKRLSSGLERWLSG